MSAAPDDQTSHPHNAALLIDFDNVTMGVRSDLQAQLRKLLDSEIIKGKVAVQRAYADWRRYPQYIVPLSEASIDLIFAPAFGSNKKNATDIRLAIDALELVFTRPEIGTFILLSGDSDFSSLVLKLKEYGKYIIGVGIRESSSDLLIQNCDEYYSYTEVTGLAKEGEVEYLRRDPWELVVEAVSQMKRERDVMRSDRLKQVMQAIDPNFDEKETGFNRFSRFVTAAAGRGLLTLEKLDNGQYAVELGSNANVPPEQEAELRSGEQASRESRGRRKRPSRRRGDGEGRQRSRDGEARQRGREGEARQRSREGEAKRKGVTLGEAFNLLRQALTALGAAGEKATEADAARAKMIELLGDESDPVFDRSRFQRLMRQAHDADVIELAKGDGDVYQLKLNPLSTPESDFIEPEVEPEAAPVTADDDGAEESAAPRPRRSRSTTKKAKKTTKTAKTTKAAKTTKRKTAKSKTSKSAKSAKGRGRSKAEAEAEVPTAPSAEPAPSQAQRDEGEGRAKQRHPRYRRGSRGGERVRKPAEGEAEQKPATDETAQTPAGRPTSSGTRSLRHRGGTRRGRGAPRREQEGAEPPRGQEPTGGGRTGRVEPAAPAPKAESSPAPKAESSPTPKVEPAPAPKAERAPAPKAAPQEEESGEGGGLLRRMTAALSKVVKGPDSE
jgi:uncharacterized protein (TIGR00288 family)